MQTSSNPDPSADMTEQTIHCFDPQNPSEPCPICGGMSVIKHDVPVGHPDFGKLFRCPNSMDDADAERKEKLRRLGNLEAYRDKRLESFYIELPGYSEYYNGSLRAAMRAATDFMGDQHTLLVLEGSTGCGKTHLATAIGNAYLDLGRRVWFMNAPDLLDHLRATYQPNSELGYDQLFDRVKDIDLLILDDLGTENPSPWAQEKLFQIIDYRYTQSRPTVITTNTRVEDMEDRLRSRLLDNRQKRANRCVIVAPDYRTGGSTRDFISSNLNTYQRMTFESFDTNTKTLQQERSNLQRALQAATTYAAKPEGWIVLLGTYGAGKTHLAAAIANYLEQTVGNVVFVTIPDLMDYLRQTFDPSSHQRFDYRFDLVRTAKLLVLDDLKSDYSSAWVKEKLFQILDYRYLRDMATVITISDDNFDKLDARIASRVTDQRISNLFRIEAPSYADRMKRK